MALMRHRSRRKGGVLQEFIESKGPVLVISLVLGPGIIPGI